VRHVDVLPTVLAALGAEAPAPVAGCNLLALLREAGGRRDPRCLVAVSEIAQPDRSLTVAVRVGRWKYIAHQRRPAELYDLAADPGETRSVAAEHPGEAARLAAVVARIAADRGSSERIELDAALERELRALGYVD
jgi:choline-sulfatase